MVWASPQLASHQANDGNVSFHASLCKLSVAATCKFIIEVERVQMFHLDLILSR
jgi:hypothetical protein